MAEEKPYNKIYKNHFFSAHEWILKSEGDVTDNGSKTGFFRLFECIKCGRLRMNKSTTSEY